MKIDDFMNQASGYNVDADTITGYFNLDEENTMEKAISVLETIKKVDKKTDFLMAIDAITDTKIEAVVLTFVVTEKLNELSESDDLLAPKIAMAVAVCTQKGLIEQENAEDILEIFAIVFGKL
jgi:nitrogen regulatory protein PII-like uncharacterized protein